MHSAATAGEVSLHTEDGIGTLTFYHPSHNAMPGIQLQRLTDAIQKAGTDPDVRVILLQSAGERTFCAGASFDELASIRTLEEGKAFFSGFARVINACRTSPKIILTRVQGKAVGGGVGIAAAGDYCFATRHAALRLSELAVGIGPFVVGPVIERKIGTTAFRQMALKPNDWFDADWALQKGLYQEVLPDMDALDVAVRQMAMQMASFHPQALTELKRVFWQGTEDWDRLLEERAATSGTLVLSSFTREAIAAFKQK